MTSRLPRKVTGFMDGVEWEYELGHAPDGNKVFPSVENVAGGTDHDISECGIAQVEVRFVRWVKEPKV